MNGDIFGLQKLKHVLGQKHLTLGRSYPGGRTSGSAGNKPVSAGQVGALLLTTVPQLFPKQPEFLLQSCYETARGLLVLIGRAQNKERLPYRRAALRLDPGHRLHANFRQS